MVPPRQLDYAVRKGKVFVWMTADPDTNQVEIKGWNTAAEVKEKGFPLKTLCDNIWLKKYQDVLPPSSLITYIKSHTTSKDSLHTAPLDRFALSPSS